MKYTAIILGAMGDFLLTLPLLCQLRQRGSISIITRGHYRALLPSELTHDGFFDIDGAAAAGLFCDQTALTDSLSSVFADAEVHAFMRLDETVSRQIVAAGATDIVWHNPRPQAPPHIVERFFADAGLTVPEGLLETPVMPRKHSGGDMLWVHAGSGSAAKNLPPADFAARLVRAAKACKGVRLSFGEADLDLRQPLQEALRQCGLQAEFLVCPRLSELRKRLTLEAAAYVGVDTGVTHLAAALGIPTTVIFRSTDPNIWRPVGHVDVEIFQP